MNILYIHQYFKTPSEGGSVRSYHLARGLVENGHRVSMITTFNAEKDVTKEIDGITVHYLAIPYDNSFSFFKRVFAFLKFLAKAINKSSEVENVDLAYVMTTPLSTGMVALWLKWFKNIPYAFEIGDLWPEVPIQMGILRNSITIYFSKWLEKASYKNADKLIALSPEIKSEIKKVVPEKPIFTIPNFCDNQIFEPNLNREVKRLRVLYCGTVGLANHLQYLVEVARVSQDQSLPIQFTIVGAGAKFDTISKLAEEVDNLKILPFRNQFELKQLIDKHDAFYVSFQSIRVLHSGSPNKLFDGLASGKLIISNLDGWTRDIIEYSKCGFYYNPDCPTDFIERVKPFLESKELLITAQQNSRAIAEGYFDKSIMIELQNDILSGFVTQDKFLLPK